MKTYEKFKEHKQQMSDHINHFTKFLTALQETLSVLYATESQEEIDMIEKGQDPEYVKQKYEVLSCLRNVYGILEQCEDKLFFADVIMSDFLQSETGVDEIDESKDEDRKISCSQIDRKIEYYRKKHEGPLPEINIFQGQEKWTSDI